MAPKEDKAQKSDTVLVEVQRAISTGGLRVAPDIDRNRKITNKPVITMSRAEAQAWGPAYVKIMETPADKQAVPSDVK